jgi:hypothetical protein
MEFIVLSLCIVALTKLIDSGTVEKILLKLVELEEDHFIAGFHQRFIKNAKMHGMTNILNKRSSRWET